jgi:Resolvase, N terminal domain
VSAGSRLRAGVCAYAKRMFRCGLRPYTRRPEDHHLRVERSRGKQERNTAIMPTERNDQLTSAYNPELPREGNQDRNKLRNATAGAGGGIPHGAKLTLPLPDIIRSYCVRKICAQSEASLTVYGYARVSTIGQTLAAQEATLHEAGAAKVFKEKISGAANHRAQLHRLLKTIDAGDIVIVTRLDRLARSTRDLLNILDKIAEAGATFKSLGDAWADTSTGPRPLDVDGSWRVS